ncbi:MAG: DUF4070 domain-containing protein [Anaerolineales bacterium]|nr:DUF4070 domain-containing protein [Anaerolineales bacterium]
MNTLLIYPEIPETFWSFKHALRFIGKRASQPPLGLVTVASMLPEDWSVQLIDLNVRSLKESHLKWADLVLVSAMTLQRDSAREVISRSKNAGCTVIAGGPLFTLEHETFNQVDYFVLNEAEITLPIFLEDFRSGTPRHIYSSTEFADLEGSPVPRWALYEQNRYATMGIQFSRGCPFDCEFCNVTTLFGHKPRTKSAAQIIHELDALYESGWRGNVFFVDDNLIGNRKALKEELLPALIKWRKNKLGYRFNTQASINLADDEQLTRSMVEAGFRTVFIGVETPSEESLSECGKKHNLHRNLVDDIKKLQHAGLEVQGGFIVGFDHDTNSIFQRQIDFIQKTGIVTAMVGMLQAPIGTKLFERLNKTGRLLGQMSGDNVDGSTNILPRMGLDTLHQGYQHILETIYHPRLYYERVKTFLREYEPPRVHIKLPFRQIFENLRALIRSMVQLGMLGKERLEYWKLLGWTLLRRPRQLPTAVTLAIYGYHFRTICSP